MSDSAVAFINADKNSHILALSVRRLATISALGEVDEHFYERLFSRQIDWLTCLINSRDERLSYDLRIITNPDPDLYQRGRLTIALLCRTQGFTKDQAHSHTHELLHLCEAFFEDEYEFELVSDAAELDWLRQPFNIEAATEITRRAEMTGLDTLRNEFVKPPLGFTPQNAAKAEPAGTIAVNLQNRVYHVYPFFPNMEPPTRLFKLLLMQSHPLALSIRLRPTALLANETEFLEEQIERCERYAQISIGAAGEKPEMLRPTLQEQARAFQRRFTKSLLALKDNAALLRVEVVGTRSIPQTVVDCLGAQISQPAGSRGLGENLESFLQGGYEFNQCEGEALQEIKRGFAHLDFVLQSDPTTPPQAHRLRYLLDSREATAAFRLPVPTLEETPGLQLKTTRTQLAPPAIPETGHLIGVSRHNGREQPVRVSRDDRRRHLYAVGQTGTGKTTLLESMILSDINGGEGVCVIDPHGDLFEKLLAKIPPSRANDVVLFDPSDTERPVALNMLEYESEAQKYFLVQEIIAILERLFEDKYTGAASVTGPVFYQHVRMVLLLVMNNPDDIGTIVQFHHVFNAPGFYKRFLPLRSTDPLLEKFVQGTLAKIDYVRPGSDNVSMGGYVSSKFDGFVFDPMLRNIFGQRYSTVNLHEIMDGGKILLVNLSKGRLGEINSRFLGMVLLAKLQAAAMARASQPIHQRRDFYLYVDEFQNLATLNFGTLLSEARKFRLNIILANQYVSQIDPRISQAIAGNVGTLIAFRVGSVDAETLEREFIPVFNRSNLINLPNFNAYVSMLVNGQVSKPFSMQIQRDDTPLDLESAARVQLLSRESYGKDRAKVEREIAESLERHKAGETPGDSEEPDERLLEEMKDD